MIWLFKVHWVYVSDWLLQIPIGQFTFTHWPVDYLKYTLPQNFCFVLYRFVLEYQMVYCLCAVSAWALNFLQFLIDASKMEYLIFSIPKCSIYIYIYNKEQCSVKNNNRMVCYLLTLGDMFRFHWNHHQGLCKNTNPLLGSFYHLYMFYSNLSRMYCR